MIRKMSVDGDGPINHEEFVKMAMANGRERETPVISRMIAATLHGTTACRR